VEAPGGVRAWSADAASGLVGEPAGAEDAEGAGESADPAAGGGGGGGGGAGGGAAGRGAGARLVDPRLHTLPDPRLLQLPQPGAQLLICPFDRETEGSFVHGELVRASGIERVHAVHGGSHATDEGGAVGGGRIQDLPGRRQRIEHGYPHAPETRR